MLENNLEIVNNNVFEDIKHIDNDGNEYWLGRELMAALEYKRWDKFNNVMENAKVSCRNSNYNVLDHFSQVGKMIEIAKGAKRKNSGLQTIKIRLLFNSAEC